MLGHIGFSYIGAVFLLLLIIPNLIWTKKQPNGYHTDNENRILLYFERIGEVLVTCSAFIFSDFNIKPWSIWSLWLVGAILFMLFYELWWLRYFKSDRNLSDFYSSFLHIPIAGAALPVIAFLLLGIYGKVIWLILSVIILGIGHIGIHYEHYKEIVREY